MLWICMGTVLGAIALLAGWVISIRVGMARHRAALREAIRAYATKRGGSVDFDAEGLGFRVKGPLGEGHERGTALEIMCKRGEEARWETSIGFVLRKYIPDAFDEAFAKQAEKRLAELGPQIARLSEDELRDKLRLRVIGTRSPSDGLATCARPLAGRFESRVVLDGFDLEGLPKAARIRLSETDDELRARALAATLPATPPFVDAGRTDDWHWLLRPEAIFGQSPHLLVATGRALAWTPVEPGDVEARLAELCRLSAEDGPAKYVLFSWDGQRLGAETIVLHTILGPTTPDYTLKVPVAFHETLGIHPASDGTFGIRRSARR